MPCKLQTRDKAARPAFAITQDLQKVTRREYAGIEIEPAGEFKGPFAAQHLGADDKETSVVKPGAQLGPDKASFNRLSEADLVGNEETSRWVDPVVRGNTES